MSLTRFAMMAAAAGFAASFPLAGAAQVGPAIRLLKDPNFGCCTAWIGILKEDGITVTTERIVGTLLIRQKLDNGIPRTWPPVTPVKSRAT